MCLTEKNQNNTLPKTEKVCKSKVRFLNGQDLNRHGIFFLFHEAKDKPTPSQKNTENTTKVQEWDSLLDSTSISAIREKSYKAFIPCKDRCGLFYSEFEHFDKKIRHIVEMSIEMVL